MTGPAKNLLKKSIGIFLAVFFAPHMVSAATLIGVSSVSAIEKGETVPIEWYLDTEGDTINAVELGLVFSAETLDLTAEPGRSLISLWVKSPSANNELGLVTLVGGAPGGLTGVVPLFRTNATGVVEGPAVFALTPDSRVYLHDGSGTEKEVVLPQFQLSVVPAQKPTIISKTHPDQNAWYQKTNVELAFPYDPTKKYGYTFTNDFNSFPGDVPQETMGTVSYKNIFDGVYYFRLSERAAEGTVQDKGVYRVQIDRTPPESFTPLIATSTDLYDGESFLSWSTVDKTSGIAYYRVRTGFFGFWRDATSPQKLSRPLVGDTVRVRAYDTAGNYFDAFAPFPGYVSVPIFYTLIGLLGALLALCGVYSRRKDVHS